MNQQTMPGGGTTGAERGRGSDVKVHAALARGSKVAQYQDLVIGRRGWWPLLRFELITFAAATALRSTLCSLAHGRALMEFIPEEDVLAIARGEAPSSISAAEAAMVAFARKVARDASSVEASDVAELKRHGFTDGEVFDISAAAAARAFWTKLVESLGVEPEPPFRAMSSAFKDALAVGRPLDFAG